MFSKVLVANRGEIAIRAFRAAYELGAATVAVYPYEDRNSVHRLKADESYQIGSPGHPARTYLSVEEIVSAARNAGADAIYPGYGFLSENPDLAAACESAGITFVGPSADVLALAGNKARAIEAAQAAGLPVLASSPPSSDVTTLLAAAAEMQFPVFVKAVAGGGVRGMRRVSERSQLREAIEAAAREAESAFGDPTVFLEQAVIDPRHIEVQILADAEGNVIHLFERDCSVQRRHQKVVELAPAPNLDPVLRERICADAVAFARQIGYSCAGTVEFLVDGLGNHVFIEMNPLDETDLAGSSAERRATLNRLLFPGPTKEFLAHRHTYGDTSGLSANQFFYGLRRGEEHRVHLEKGVTLLIGLEAISDPDERGMRTVMCILNGQLRPVSVRDRSITSDIPAAEKADKTNPDHIAAPFAGVVTLTVTEGDKVNAGDPIATIEAMKMEAAITAPRGGLISRVASPPSNRSKAATSSPSSPSPRKPVPNETTHWAGA